MVPDALNDNKVTFLRKPYNLEMVVTLLRLMVFTPRDHSATDGRRARAEIPSKRMPALSAARASTLPYSWNAIGHSILTGLGVINIQSGTK